MIRRLNSTVPRLELVLGLAKFLTRQTLKGRKVQEVRYKFVFNESSAEFNGS